MEEDQFIGLTEFLKVQPASEGADTDCFTVELTRKFNFKSAMYQKIRLYTLVGPASLSTPTATPHHNFASSKFHFEKGPSVTFREPLESGPGMPRVRLSKSNMKST